ncbi:mate-domain-containing protein [Coniochaeta sp. 2T2.1]|nr:mate-domain-containing protein [Coniochaeta sp. 2T2.1]KAB5532596.1 mate-domain-containing protein [Coniochaeta sp. 2T2.1]
MPGNQPIPPRPTTGTTHHDFASSLVQSFQASSPLAQEVLARDLAECSSDEDEPEDAAVDEALSSEEDDEDAGRTPVLFRRPSGIAFGTARPALAVPPTSEPFLSRAERRQSRDAERSLLRDNHILPPKHPVEEKPGFFKTVYKRMFSTKVPLPEIVDEETAPTETDPLLGAGGAQIPQDGHEHLNDHWEAAVAEGKIKTTWQREAKTITVYSRSLIITFLLQYSINVASIFAVGRIGKLELGAVSLATMTANITCYAPFQGLATSLDTLCAQAFGSGHKHLVGLQLQRMTYFLWSMIIPIAIVWFKSEDILALMIPEHRSAELAGQYLKVVIFGTPAMVAFEGGKRFVQAQGLFHATTYVLLVAAPINILLNYLLVWRFDMGFIGAPIAVVITQNLLPLLLFLYVWLIDGSQCWGGFSKRALSNWGPMVRLALPGMIMVEAEWFAFEILTLATGQFGSSFLAAQSILVTLTSTTFQIPFPLSIAGSTRVANLIGAKLPDAAKTSAKVTFAGGLLVGIFNLTLVSALRYQIPLLFTHDPEVIELVARVMPVVAFMQVFDGLAAVSHGLLRGIGRQEIGGYVNLAAYYIVALPISFGLGFGLDMKLTGLWAGVTAGLILVSIIEYWVIYRADWDRSVDEAQERNASG